MEKLRGHGMNRPNKVIIHCTATLDSTNPHLRAADVDRWHKENGWKGIGYHWFIGRDGLIEHGRLETEPGAHTIGENRTSIGIAYAGSKKPTFAQMDSFKVLYSNIKKRWNIGWEDWHGHREYAVKDCPGFDIILLRYILSGIDDGISINATS